MSFILGSSDSSRGLPIIYNDGIPPELGMPASNILIPNAIDSSFNVDSFYAGRLIDGDFTYFDGTAGDKYPNNMMVADGIIYVGMPYESDGTQAGSGTGTDRSGQVHLFKNGKRIAIYGNDKDAGIYQFGFPYDSVQRFGSDLWDWGKYWATLTYGDAFDRNHNGLISVFAKDSDIDRQNLGLLDWNSNAADRTITRPTLVSYANSWGYYPSGNSIGYQNGRVLGNHDSNTAYIYDVLDLNNPIGQIDRHDSGSYIIKPNNHNFQAYGADGYWAVMNSGHANRRGCIEIFDLDGTWVNTIRLENAGYLPANNYPKLYGMYGGRIYAQYWNAGSLGGVPWGIRAYNYLGTTVGYIDSIGNETDPYSDGRWVSQFNITANDGYVFAMARDRTAKLYDANLNEIHKFPKFSTSWFHLRDAQIDNGYLYLRISSVPSKRYIWKIPLPYTMDTHFSQLIRSNR